MTCGVAALTSAERGLQAPSSFLLIVSCYPGVARKTFFSREIRGMFSTENVLARPLCRGLSGVCVRCVGFWGNVMFKLLECAFLLPKEISL